MTPVLRAQYVQWFRSNLPGFRQAMDKAPSNVRAGLAGFGLADDSPDTIFGTTSTTPATSSSSDSFNWGSLVQSLGTAASQYLMTDAQIKTNQQITNLQLQRAAQGLMPLSIAQLQSQYGIATTPTANVGLSPDTKTFLMYTGIGLGLIYLFSSRRR
jgi:hypothetical protein